MNPRALVVTISILVLVTFGATVMWYQPTPIPPAQTSTTPTADQPVSTTANLVRFHSPAFGKANASVTIVEFFDPSCEACRAFYPYVKKILAEHPDDVRLVLRYTLLHQGSEEVARLLEASRKQNLYQQVLEAVLEAQPGWHDDPQVAKAWEAAQSAGLDLDRARSDMQSAGVDAALKVDRQDVKTIGVQGTPTFFVNGQSLNEFSPQALRQLVRDEVAKTKE